MYIKKIKLENFRNYTEQEIEFDKNVNIIYGDNAQGKTNILEAIFLCSLGKSFRTNKDKELININKENANVEIEIQTTNREKKINLKIEEKKYFSVNNISIKKMSELLGNIYVVLFTPEDIGILKNEPNKRRRFLNIMISQLKPNYVYLLNKYNKIMEQRNIYLKQIKYENKTSDILDIWDEQLSEIGERIYQYRKEFIEKINNKIKIIHLNTTNNKENINIKYKSNLCEGFYEKLKNNRRIDIEKGYTSLGIHRDDFEIYINNQLVSVYGSQGQMRTSIISLKIAEAEVIYEEIGERPILLLDDFMSELDKKRIQGFFENIKENQVLITCTDSFKINNSFYNLYKVNNAIIEKITKI
ncbi:MAG: DNA replication/repair protein RecF [Clostridiales bacterium]|nr:DNA replication/repair protein RecF [Clostridiales bacterium]